MKKILIVETYYEGHYLTGYIKYILRSLKNKKFTVTLLTSNNTLKYGKGAIEILKKEKVNFKILTTNFDTNTSLFSNNFYLNQIINYIKIKKLFKKKSNSKYDIIFFSSLQRFLIPLSLFGNPFKNTPVLGVFLGAKFHLNYFGINQKGSFDLIYNFLFELLLKKNFIKKVILNDHLLEKYFKKIDDSINKKILFLHDPKETRFKYKKNKIKKSFNLSSNHKYLLLYGALIESKGVEELFKIIKSKNINKNLRLIIAGRQFAQIKNFLKSDKILQLIKQKKITIFEGWQSEKMEAKLFSISDMVWIAYKNYSSPSGVLYQAASLGLPVIVSNDGMINKLNNKYDFGVSININDPDASAKKISKLLNNKTYKNYSKNIKKFYNISNPDNWTKGFSKIISKF